MPVQTQPPRFTLDHLGARLGTGDLGAAFQRFAYEVLLVQNSHLEPFPAGGKDGCIDICSVEAGHIEVVECKCIGIDGLQETLRRWSAVADVLRRNIQSPAGPPAGQSQFGPWFNTSQPITSYTFCISSILENLAQRQRLQSEIATFFVNLSSSNPHLSHLGKVSVTILDWNDLYRLLRGSPHLLFRWFPNTRPVGLVPFGEPLPSATFRSYLTTARLPYYSLQQHALTHGQSADLLLDEQALLSRLTDIETTGLIITGAGGVGKTRLTLEIGRLATNSGWTVLRTSSQLRLSALEKLAETLTPGVPTLLLVDYLETQRAFADFVDLLNDLNDTYELTLRYVANCRLSYYPSIASVPRHKQVALSPAPESASRQWIETYKAALIRHILESAGLPNYPHYVPICRNLPILAVFISYLYQTGRGPQLAELLREADFGTWIAKRVQLTFGDADIARDLAHIMMLFPVSEHGFAILARKGHGTVLDRLATDGWIERSLEDSHDGYGTWYTAHDILADRVIVSYLSSVPETVDHFVDEGIELAHDVNALRSLLTSLQRLVDHPSIRACQIKRLIFSSVNSHPERWTPVRDILIRTPLLDPAERIQLLAHEPRIWTNSERDRQFHNSLSYLARWQARQVDHNTDSVNTKILIAWIRTCIGCLRDTNAPLTAALLLCPDSVKDEVFAWFRQHPFSFNNWWLLIAWLDAALPAEEMSLWMWLWLSRYMVTYQAGAVLKAWLINQGDKELVADAMLAWLDENGRELHAFRVCEAWLDARGAPQTIAQYLLPLIARFETVEIAGSAISKWLTAGGNKNVVSGHMLTYLSANAEHPDAAFILRAWIRAGGSISEVATFAHRWLAVHAADADASYLYRMWLKGGGAPDIVRPLMLKWVSAHAESEYASYVLNLLLNSKVDPMDVEEPVRTWLRNHGAIFGAIYTMLAWLRCGGAEEVVRKQMIDWVKRHSADHSIIEFIDDLIKIDSVAPQLMSSLLTTYGQALPPRGWLTVFLKLLKPVQGSELEARFVDTCEDILTPLVKGEAALERAKPLQLDSLMWRLLQEWNIRNTDVTVRIDRLALEWLSRRWSLGAFKVKGHGVTGSGTAKRLQTDACCRRLLTLFNNAELRERYKPALIRVLHWINSWAPNRRIAVEPALREWRSSFDSADASFIDG